MGCALAHAVIAVDVALTGCNAIGATTCTITLSPTANSSIIVAGSYRKDNCNLSATAVTDTSSDTFTVHLDIASGDTHRNLMFAHVDGIAAGNSSVVIHFSASCDASFIAGSYTGLPASSFDVNTAAVKTASSTSESTNSYTTTATDLLFTLVMQGTNGTTTFTATAPWTHGTNQANGTDGMVVGVEDQLNVAAGSQAGAWTSTSVTWYAVGISFKAAAAGSTKNLSTTGAGS